MAQGRFMMIALVTLAIGVVLFVSYNSLQRVQETPGGQQDTYGPAPDLTMPIGKNGATVQLSDLKDRVVLLDFWASWCNPCKMSIPELQRLYEKYKDQGLVVIGLSTDDDKSRKDAPRVRSELGMTYAMAFTDDIPDARSKYEFQSLPMLFVIDRKGVIRDRINGYDPNGNLEDEVVKLLKESAKKN